VGEESERFVKGKFTTSHNHNIVKQPGKFPIMRNEEPYELGEINQKSQIPTTDVPSTTSANVLKEI